MVEQDDLMARLREAEAAERQLAELRELAEAAPALRAELAIRARRENRMRERQGAEEAARRALAELKAVEPTVGREFEQLARAAAALRATLEATRPALTRVFEVAQSIATLDVEGELDLAGELGNSARVHAARALVESPEAAERVLHAIAGAAWRPGSSLDLSDDFRQKVWRFVQGLAFGVTRIPLPRA